MIGIRRRSPIKVVANRVESVAYIIPIKTLVFRFPNNSMCAVGMVRLGNFSTAVSVFADHMRPIFIFRPLAGRIRDLGGLAVCIPKGREPMDSAAGGKKMRKSGKPGNPGNPGLRWRNRQRKIRRSLGADFAKFVGMAAHYRLTYFGKCIY